MAARTVAAAVAIAIAVAVAVPLTATITVMPGPIVARSIIHRVVMAGGGIIARARIVAVTKAKANDRRRRRIHDARRGGDINDLRRLLGVHHLRLLRVHHLGLLVVHRRRIRDYHALLYGRGLVDHLRGGLIDRPLLINRGGLINLALLVHRGGLINLALPVNLILLLAHDRADHGTGDSADRDALGPTIAVVTTDKSAGHGTQHCARRGRGADHLRLGGAKTSHGERESNDECFHFVGETDAAARLFSQIRFTKRETPPPIPRAA